MLCEKCIVYKPVKFSTNLSNLLQTCQIFYKPVKFSDGIMVFLYTTVQVHKVILLLITTIIITIVIVIVLICFLKTCLQWQLHAVIVFLSIGDPGLVDLAGAVEPVVLLEFAAEEQLVVAEPDGSRGIALHLQVVDQLSPGCVPLQGSGSTTCSKLWLKCKVNAAEMW